MIRTTDLDRAKLVAYAERLLMVACFLMDDGRNIMATDVRDISEDIRQIAVGSGIADMLREN